MDTTFGFIPTHYMYEMSDWVSACGSEDGYQTWQPREVTCPECKAEM